MKVISRLNASIERRVFVSVLASAALVVLNVFFSSSAFGEVCGRVVVESDENTAVFIGIESNSAGFPVNRTNRNLAACIESITGRRREFVSLPDCNVATADVDNLWVWFGSGNDELNPMFPGTITKECGDSSGKFLAAIGTDEWGAGRARFSFGIEAHLGAGSDTAFGTPNRDIFYSNRGIEGPDPISTMPGATRLVTLSDGANDTLCGFGGNDVLFGDYDDSSEFAECLIGGDGNDECYGRGDPTGEDDDFDRASCEITHSAQPTMVVIGAGDPSPAGYGCGSSDPALRGVIVCLSACMFKCMVDPWFRVIRPTK